MSARRYYKKPVVVEALRYEPDGSNQEIVERWCGGSAKGIGLARNHRWIAIQTLEGEMAALPGDYIIKGTRGEFYPCKPEAFEDTFEVAE